MSPTAPVVVDEVFGGGGNTGGPYTNDFVELANTTDAPVSLDGWSLQYASSTGAFQAGAQVTPLSGSIPARGSYLVQLAAGNTPAQALPTPDATGTTAMSATKGVVALVSSTSALDCEPTACATDPAVVDLVGFGTGTVRFAGSGPASGPSNSTAITRTAHTNSADNAADFTVAAPNPRNAAGEGTPSPQPPGPATPATIAEIQGTSAASPLVGSVVTTEGWVTAAYPTGGFNGLVVQTAGTGGTCQADGTASRAVFVYTGAAPTATVGQYVEVTGKVTEFDGLTEITDSTVTDLPTEGIAPVSAASCSWPSTEAGRESLESMLVLPQGEFTISSTYTTHQYGDVVLAAGTTPLRQPTDVAPHASAAHDAVAADNAARMVTLDDGSTWNYLSAGNNTLVPPYVTADGAVRVGGTVEFTTPVVVDYRNAAWKLNPTTQVTAAAPASSPVTFDSPRPQTPDTAALGEADVTVASFNVLNYFTTTGDSVPGCTAYTDKDGAGVTVKSCSGGQGPRGAWSAADLVRQQDKIVSALTALDADIVGLMEIENSAALGKPADSALATLVDALNTRAGSPVWAFVPSSADLPAADLQDVVTTAIIYKVAEVTPLGSSRALGTLSAPGQAFDNAREPVGQAFAPVGGGEPLFVVANHFKSKSAGSATGPDADTGQGAWNPARVAQATALTSWVSDTALPAISVETGVLVEDVALVGDFNAYTQEDPLLEFYAAEYSDATTLAGRGEASYSYSGLNGSLDHVLVNASALSRFTGADVWEINSPESIALEYSRINTTGGNFYTADAFRSSDHDPVIAGFRAAASDTTITLLNINDFHGRIDTNTVAFAGTVEQQRALGGEDTTLLLSAGDNIGASLFASATQADQPTIDVLNVLGLRASAVGNHELDKGSADLTGRVTDEMDASYLAANVYDKGTTTPAFPEYAIFDVDGVSVAVVGALTEETPSLVSPDGVASLDFGDPVEAVNRVAAQLSDGDEANGEADVIVAEYHEGAGSGTPEGATLDAEIAAGGAFASIVTDTSAEVDAIFTGHTHKQYVWEAQVPGAVDGSTRPIVQTGSYGAFIGKVTLTVDLVSGDVTGHTAANVARTTTPAAQLVEEFPRVAEVKTIVDAALAHATEKGDVPVGSITGDISTAFTGGTYSPESTYTGGTRDNRAEASALGTLVGNALRDSLAQLPAAPDFGVVNPGGMRADLDYEADGVVTFAEAQAVLPFNNELTVVTLTGAQVVTMLEQQWQRDSAGQVPSRAYLQLGLSDNVSYTYEEVPDPADATQRVGVIRSVTIDGAPIDLTASYRVGTFSFLASGGDNFRVLADGASRVNTGLLDWEGWVAYLEAGSPVSPSYARSGVQVTGVDIAAGERLALKAGTSTSVDLSRLDLFSQGAPLNTTVSASFGGTTLGSADVSDGAASLTLAVPTSAAGDGLLTLIAQPSGTIAVLPVTVEAVIDPTPDPTPTTPDPTPTTPDLGASATLTLGATEVLAGGQLTVRVSDGPSGGTIDTWLYSDPVQLGTITLDGTGTGSGTFTVPASTPAGQHTLRVVGSGIDLSVPVTVLAAGTSPADPPATTGSATTGPAGTPSGLAATGAQVATVVAIAVLVGAAGIVLVVIRRRRGGRAG